MISYIQTVSHELYSMSRPWHQIAEQLYSFSTSSIGSLSTGTKEVSTELGTEGSRPLTGIIFYLES